MMNARPDIVIAGGGGFGCEIVEYVRRDIADGRLQAQLRGVIDDSGEDAVRRRVDAAYLGSIRDYRPNPGDRIIIALGSPRARMAVAETLRRAGADFFTYVHSSVYVGARVRLGLGVVICPGSIVNTGASLGDFSVLNVLCSVGHGATLGDYSVLSPYAAMNGDCSVGVGCFLGTRATVFPRVTVGDYCTVDSHGYVKASVEARKIISSRGQYVVVDDRLAVR